MKSTPPALQSTGAVSAVAPPGGRTEQSAERDGGREAGKVDEEEGGEALDVEAVAEVAQVPRVAALHVVQQPPKEALGALQGVTVHVDWRRH